MRIELTVRVLLCSSPPSLPSPSPPLTSTSFASFTKSDSTFAPEDFADDTAEVWYDSPTWEGVGSNLAILGCEKDVELGTKFIELVCFPPT